MTIQDRRAREREKRRKDILDAAWSVAEDVGWASFSVERVAAKAELGRATVYGYFESLEALIDAMAEAALHLLSERVSSTRGLAEALDAPLRFFQASPAAFALLFQQPVVDSRTASPNDNLERVRHEARNLIGTLQRMASRSRATLPEDSASAQAFLEGIAMAGVTVPELRSNTPLRRRWQEFCLELDSSREVGGPADPASPPRDPEPR